MSEFCSLNIWDFAHKKANFHTHTTRCHHASGLDREYVEQAIAGGYQVLGFSDHGPIVRHDGYVSHIRMAPEELEGYMASLEALRAEFRGEIELYIGLEVEYMPRFFRETVDFYRQFPIDYLILGQHYFAEEGLTPYVADALTDPKYVEEYVQAVSDALDTGLFLYQAHTDLLRFCGDQGRYWAGMQKILDILKSKNLPVEVNGNGFREGRHYPNAEFLRMAADNGNPFLIGVDAHAPDRLTETATLEGCRKLVEQVGGKLICL